MGINCSAVKYVRPTRFTEMIFLLLNVRVYIYIYIYTLIHIVCILYCVVIRGNKEGREKYCFFRYSHIGIRYIYIYIVIYIKRVTFMAQRLIYVFEVQFRTSSHLVNK